MTLMNFRIEQTRIQGTVPGPRSTELNARREAAVPRAVSPGLPGYIADADGGILKDVDGNAWIDFGSGIAVTSVGASHPKVVEAVSDAVSHFTHTCFMVSPYASYVEVAEKLNEITPGDHEKKTILLNSGAEAVENAVKIARAHTNRNAVVVFDNAFHGRTNLTMTMTAKNKPYKTGFGTLAADISRAPMSYPLRDGLSGQEAADRAIRMIEKEVGAENLAAVVIEPIQGEGGFIVPAEGFLPALVNWCNDNDVVFIADEIQSGLARTGKWFASDWEGIVPDLVTTAKGIAGGMPLSAVTGRADIMDAPVPGALGGTYGGNPVAVAAAKATLSVMEDEDLFARATRIEEIVREELAALDSTGRVAEIRGRGAMIALELVDASGKPDADLTAAVAAACKKEGVLILTCGMDGNVIRLLPPLVIGEDLLREGLQVLVEQFKAAV